MVLRHSTTISSRKSSTSSGSNPSLNRTCWNCLVTTSSGVNAIVVSSFDSSGRRPTSGGPTAERPPYQASIVGASGPCEGARDAQQHEAEQHRERECEVDRDRSDTQ